ncbi:MAG: IS66 family insertion sequence element accessory protein TnpA [Enterovibrio sp.]
MAIRRTQAQWQQLFAQHAAFSGTTTEFCKQNNVSLTTFYSRRSQLASSVQSQAELAPQLTAASPKNFIQVIQSATTNDAAKSCAIQFDTRTGLLTLAENLKPEFILAIIKGLSA